MNSYEKFEQIYSKIVENNAGNLEASRYMAKNEIIRNITIITMSILIGFALYSFLYKIFYPNDEIVHFLIFIYGVIALIIYIKVNSESKKSRVDQYRDNFKTKIVKALLDSFEENIIYFPDQGMSAYSYSDADFEEYNRYSSEDLMQGVLKNNCNFSMAEILTEYVTTDENDKIQCKTLFCGMMSKVETPKPFNACLYLRKDRKDKNILVRTFKYKPHFDKLRVELDSREFEKRFDVYCTDKIVAMQLLTADIMQLLIEFQEEMNMEYELTIKNNLIYIRFMSGKMFEPTSVMKFSLDKPTLYKYYKMLDFTFTLTDKLIKLIEDTEYNY